MKMLDHVIEIHLGKIGDLIYQFSVKSKYIVAYEQKPGQPMKFLGFWSKKVDVSQE
jgi:hypothetical protein